MESFFERMLIVGFRRAKRLKDILVRAKVAPLKMNIGSCKLRGGNSCEIRKHVITTEISTSFSTQR